MERQEELKKALDYIKKKFDVAISESLANDALYGNGNEIKSVYSGNSSALQALLVFSQVSETNPLVIDGIKYTEVHFEYKNKVINYPSSLDVVLLDGREGEERNCLCIESKYSEYFNSGKNLVVGPSYLSKDQNGYYKKLNLSAKELIGLGIDLEEKMLEKFREKSSNEISLILKDYNFKLGRFTKKRNNDIELINSVGIKPILGNEHVYSYGIKQILSHTIGIINMHNPNGYKRCSNYLKDEKFKTVKFLTIDNDYLNNISDLNRKIVDDVHKHESYLLNLLRSKDYKCDGIPITFLNPTTYQELFENNKPYFDNLPKVVSYYNLDWNIKLGPFFYLNNQLLYNTKNVNKCELHIDKLDNIYSHEELFEKKYGDRLDYIDYPRGRVIWDIANKRAIIYIDPCINKQVIIDKIANVFNLKDYVVEGDIHYHCKKCSDEIWNS